MDMKTFMQISSDEDREALARAIQSSVGYFRQIAGGHKKPGAKFCRKLVEADPRFTLSELRPDYWPPSLSSSRNRRSTDKNQ